MKTVIHYAILFSRSRKRLLSLLLACVCVMGLQAQTTSFQYAEYFFDSDPGFYNGTQIPAAVTPDSITISATINTTGLNTGYHTLFVRTQHSRTGNDTLRWSLSEGKTFFIKPSITFAEYFIDTDPGVGNGTSLPVIADEDSITVSASIITGILSGGTHRLYVRTRDNAGNYSLHEGQPFFVTSGATISAAEWFIDTDPGVGNGTALAINGLDSADFTGSIVTPNNLSGGTHFLYVRAKTQTGLWGLYEPKPFYVTTQTTLSAAEWFIDTDPGIGNGTALSINGLDSADFTGSIVTPNNLAGGPHFLYVRAKTQAGRWGLYEPKPFFVTSQTTLAAAEWFIDIDPGIGNGTALSISGLDSASFAGSIVTPNNLTGGTHFLFVRAKTLTGAWSLYEPKPFFVNLATTINAAEYFIDTDPGIGNGIPVSVTAGLDSISGTAAITIPNNLNAGTHYLYLRTRSLPGKWSLYEGRKFTVKPSIVAAEYFIDNDPGIGYANPIIITPDFDSITVNTTMATACVSSGEHYVFLRTKDSNGNWSLYEPDTITVTGTVPAIFTPGNDTICLGDSVVLSLNASTACNLQWLLNSAPIPGATNITYTAYVSGSYQLKQTTGGIDYVSNALNITVLPNCAPSVWTGNSSTNWFIPGNWNTGVVPNSCTSDVVIPATPTGAVFPDITTGSPQVHDINVQNGATISIAANRNLSVCGNWTGGIVTASSVTGNGTVSLTGTSAQQLSGKTSFQTLRLSNSAGATMQTNSFFNVFVALELESGTFHTGTGTITFKSTSATQCAVLDNFGNPYGTFSGIFDETGANGNIIAERFYAAPTANSYQQHFMGSPVDNPSFSQFNASGTAGFVTPTLDCDETQLANTSVYGNVLSYDQSNGTSCSLAGWKVETGGSAQTARGYSVARTGSGVLALAGRPNLNNSYTATGLSNGGWSNTSLQGRPMGGGWQLVSNSYLATLNLQSTPDAGMDNQVQVWNTATGSYDAYVIGANTVIPIAPFQAFMVHRSSTGAAATYTIHASDRRRNISATFYQQANDQELSINAVNQSTGLQDKTIVAFNTDATDQFDPQYDANKMAGLLSRHTFYSLNNNAWMSRNVLHSIQQTSTVNLGFEPGVSGAYTFNFDGLISFDPTSYITLEDLKLNSFHNVRTGEYNFSADASDNWNRFAMHFTPPAEINTVNQQCDTLGVIEIAQPGSAVWTYTITNSNAAIIASGSLNSGNPVITNAPAGTYTLTLTDANNYTVVKIITISGTAPITATFNSNNTTAETGDDILFTNTTTNTNSITWDFGDGTTGNSQQITHSYTTAGTYIVTLIVTNTDGCSSSVIQTINVTEKVISGILKTDNKQPIEIWSSESKLFIDFSSQNKVEATIEIYNVLGQQLVNEKFSRNAIYSKLLNNLEATYVIVRVKNENDVRVKKVFLKN